MEITKKGKRLHKDPADANNHTMFILPKTAFQRNDAKNCAAEWELITNDLVCLTCGKPLKEIGYCERGVQTESGKEIHRFPVCMCEHCHKFHRVVPDFIVPYKRYASQQIEDTLSDRPEAAAVVAENSTRNRWKRWIKDSVSAFGKKLRQLAKMGYADGVSVPIIVNDLGEQPRGWLKKFVQLMTNTVSSVHNRFTSLVQAPSGKILVVSG